MIKKEDYLKISCEEEVRRVIGYRETIEHDTHELHAQEVTKNSLSHNISF